MNNFASLETLSVSRYSALLVPHARFLSAVFASGAYASNYCWVMPKKVPNF